MCQCVLGIAIVELPDASRGTNGSRESLGFMPVTFDDHSRSANARVWDFVVPPKSRWTLPLLDELCVAQWAGNFVPGQVG